MNRQKVEQWLSMDLDGELSERQKRKLQRCLESDPSLQEVRAEWQKVGQVARSMDPPTGKPVEVVWSNLQRELRAERDEGVKTSNGAFGLRRFALAGASLVICLVVLMATRYAFQPGNVEQAAQVEWVETDIPDATTMVYQDPETGWTVVWVMDDRLDDEHAGS